MQSEYQWIGDAIKTGAISLSEHVLREMLEGRAKLSGIVSALSQGKVIEIHNHPQRKTFYVALGYVSEKPLHVMFSGSEQSGLAILVIYEPSPPMWLDHQTRSPYKEEDMQSYQHNCFFCSGRIKPIVVGNFDYRLDGNLYVVKNVPAGLCLQCGEKYLSMNVGQKIEMLVTSRQPESQEAVKVFTYPEE